MTPAPEDPAPPHVPDPYQPSSEGRLPRWAPVYAAGLAVLLTLALVGGWRTLQSHHSATPVVQDAPAVRPPIPTLTPVPDPTSVRSTPVAHPSPTASHATPRPSATASATVDRSVPVVVLNATRRTGLAARAARSLRSQGWTVAWVGNWRGGGVDRTTVFAVGYQLDARTLRSDAGASAPVRSPLPSMPTNRVVLVLGPDYPG